MQPEPVDPRLRMATAVLGLTVAALITMYYRPDYLYWPWPHDSAPYIWAILTLIVAALIAYAAISPGSPIASVAGGAAPVVMLIRSAANLGSAWLESQASHATVVLPSRVMLAWLWLWGAGAMWDFWQTMVNPWVGYHQAEKASRRRTAPHADS